MITNSELTEMGLQTVDRTSSLPVARKVFGRSGKCLGTVQHFTGTHSARDIKAQLKATGLKGKALGEAVNKALRGEVDVRQQLGVAWLQAAFSAGWTCDVGILKKTRGGLNLVKVEKEIAPVVAVEKPALSPEETRKAALATLGLTEAELELLKSL